MKEKFTYRSLYGNYEDCTFVLGYYPNNNIGIEIWSNSEGPITKVTVNPDIELPRDRIAIKDYSENEGMVDWLVSMNIIEPNPVDIIISGWVEIPVHLLTDAGKEIIGLEE